MDKCYPIFTLANMRYETNSDAAAAYWEMRKGTDSDKYAEQNFLKSQEKLVTANLWRPEESDVPFEELPHLGNSTLYFLNRRDNSGTLVMRFFIVRLLVSQAVVCAKEIDEFLAEIAE